METEREAALLKAYTENPGFGRERLSAVTGIPPASVGRWLAQRRMLEVEDAMPTEGMSVMRTNPNAAPGEPRVWWTKSKGREETLEETLKKVYNTVSAMPPLSIPECEPFVQDNLLSVYVIADPHVGMLAYGPEAGEDYDIKIAVARLEDCFSQLVKRNDGSKTAVIANLGDFTHYDGIEAKTTRAQHVLDADSRYSKMYHAGLCTLLSIINIALLKHEKVVVLSGQGNHDEKASITMSIAAQAFFRNCDRVEVRIPVNPFQYHQFGRNLIGIHHGDVKPERLALVMPTDCPEMWGATDHRLWLTGHVHHRGVMEFPGVTVESFRSVASRDAWTHRSGYRSSRSMVSIVLDKHNGEITRHTVNITTKDK